MKFNVKKLFIWLLVILIIVGFWCLTSASNIVGRDEHGDPFFFVKGQFIKGLVLGVIAFFILSKINLNFLRKFSFVFFLINTALLVLVFIEKFIPKGGATANRWVEILGFSFQPAELLKITLILFVANFLSKKSLSDLNSWSKTIVPLVLCVMPAFVLIYKQPATSIIVLFVVAIGVMCFSLKFSLKILVPIVVLAVLFIGIAILLGGKGSDYRKARITNQDDYQRRQSITGIVRGGVIGVGFGQSRQKYNYLPQSYTDSIYAVIAEEFGFVGTMAILALYFSLWFLGFYVASHSGDTFSSLFVLGTITLITVQALYHIMCMSFSQMPITGLPLPLISYGGTSYAITMASMGIFYNIINKT